MAESLFRLVTAVRLPHAARTCDGQTWLVASAGDEVRLDARLLTPAEAGALSRAVRTALVARRSETVRPVCADPIMVRRISDQACRVDGVRLCRDEAVMLAVALDAAAAQAADTPTKPHPLLLDPSRGELVTSSVSLRFEAEVGGR